MAFLKKFTPRKNETEARNIVEIEVTDPERQIPDLIQWASMGEDIRMLVPSSMLRTKGAFGFHGGWNPMMLPLRDDTGAYREFFRLFQPRNVSELYFLGERFDPDSFYPAELPWLFWSKREALRVETESNADLKPHKFFGPSTPQKIDREVQRLLAVLESIRKQGYKPDKYGDIQGYFLKLGGEFRFLVCSGKHRAAALTHLGVESIRVQMRPLWPRVIEGSRAGDWPLVRSGGVSEDFALAMMRRFFEFDGTQQRDRIFGSSPSPRHART